jgi:hypothetical protein
MAKSKDDYDAKTKTAWLFREYDDPDTLVPSEESSSWSAQLRAGKTSTGKPLSAVNYVFSSHDTAEYNRDALAFARIGTHVGTLKKHEPFGGEAPSFDTKDDFGM